MKLFYTRYTRASRPRWLLEEIGAPYELVRIDLRAGEHKQPSYLAVHPHGVVPALEDGDLKLMESAAICLYLADKFPEAGMAPPLGTPERGLHYQWAVYAMATLEPPVHQVARHTTQLPVDQRDPRQADDGKGKFRQAAEVLTGALHDRDYLLGTFGVADVLIGSVLIWAKSLGLLADFPRLVAYCERLAARPAYHRMRVD